MKILFLLAGAANLIAIFDLPYSFYGFLRWSATFAAIVLAYYAVQNKKPAWLLLAIPAAVIWNPFFGLTMVKESWFLLNIVAGASFIAAYKNQSLKT